MITGFNHNIKYKSRIYHIQTEDSGQKNPHIITHLFVGGNIIATKKADYRHLLVETNAVKLETNIRAAMEEQHKLMLRNLIHGKFDGAHNAENAHHLNGPAPLNVDPAVLARTGGSGNKSAGGTVTPPVGTPVFVRPPTAPPPPPVAREAPPPDLGALFGSLIGAEKPAVMTRDVARAPAPVDMPEGSLAPEVLAARSLKEIPVEKPVTTDTIFGEDLISEKSLDEVILSYLAEDK